MRRLSDEAYTVRHETLLSLEDARRLLEGYVEHHNNVRLNRVIGYITPKDMLGDSDRAGSEFGSGFSTAGQSVQLRSRAKLAIT